MNIPQNPPKPNTPSSDMATQQWVSTYYAQKSTKMSYRKTTPNQVVNTVTETDLLHGEIAVGASVLGTNGVLRLTAWGDSINNTGGTVAAPRLKLKLGATTLLDTNTIAGAWGANAARFGWRIVGEIQNLGAANSQWSTLSVEFAGQVVIGAVVFATGEGTYVCPASGPTFLKGIGGNSSAVDTTAAQGLALTVILPTANALEDVTLKSALVEIV